MALWRLWAKRNARNRNIEPCAAPWISGRVHWLIPVEKRLFPRVCPILGQFGKEWADGVHREKVHLASLIALFGDVNK